MVLRFMGVGEGAVALSFGSALGRGRIWPLLLGNWISGGSGPGGASLDWDELAVNQSILRWRRGRIMLGTWGGERLRRKGGIRVRIEAPLAVLGQAARGGVVRWVTSESLGVKQPAFLEFKQIIKVCPLSNCIELTFHHCVSNSDFELL